MQLKDKCLLLVASIGWLLFPTPAMAQEQAALKVSGIDIQVDRLEGTSGTRSHSFTNSSGLFYANDSQQIKTYQQQQQQKYEQRANELFTEQIEQTTHETIQQEPLFSETTSSVTMDSSATVVDSFVQASVLAPLTDHQWFWTAAALVFAAALWISYQLYKRDKYAGH